jgi:hypothetical protein
MTHKAMCIKSKCLQAALDPLKSGSKIVLTESRNANNIKSCPSLSLPDFSKKLSEGKDKVLSLLENASNDLLIQNDQIDCFVKYA